MGQHKHKPKQKHLKPAELLQQRAAAAASAKVIKLEDATVESLLESTGNWPEQILIAVGIEIHKGRRVTPTNPDDAPVGATYDDLVGITYGPIDAQAHGFRVRADCRRIGTSVVAKSAKSSCKTCHGAGKWTVKRTSAIGRDEAGRKIMNPYEYVQVCTCAERRFKDQNKHFLIDSQYGEWIALDNLTIEKVMQVQVSGIADLKEQADAVPKVPTTHDNDERNRTESVSQLPSSGG